MKAFRREKTLNGRKQTPMFIYKSKKRFPMFYDHSQL